jgi:HAD superfamily hydrolase (TIGR01484 family)
MTPPPAGVGTEDRAPRPIRLVDSAFCQRLKIFFTDIDDTLTDRGRLPESSLEALYRLERCGVAVVPVTGRPAGWCDHMARMWPVRAVVGENGAFYFSYDRERRLMRRVFLQAERERRQSFRKLSTLARRITRRFPWVTTAADQPFRLTDHAFDLCEDRTPPTPEQLKALCAFLSVRRPGPHYKISSIHLNVWWGEYDKKTCLLRLLDDLAGEGERVLPGDCLYIGDSPNDEPLFAALPVTAAVANIRRFLPELRNPPVFLADGESAAGFLETVNIILDKRRSL